MSGTIVLVSNGPGELQAWVRPVLTELRRSAPEHKVVISLIPCQFASGNETRLASSFGADNVTSPAEAVRFLAGSGKPDAFAGDSGAVLSLGGNTRMAVSIGKRLAFPTFRYSFIPFWHPGLRKLFVHDEQAFRKARLLGAPPARLANIGNLVADAVAQAEPAPRRSSPHLLLMPGSRDRYVRAVLPLMLAVAEQVTRQWPSATFSWPVSRLLSDEAIADAIHGTGPELIGGFGGERIGDDVVTPGGARVRMVPESERYSVMKSADLALAIPGTNTLEMGIAGLPAVVVLPLNRPEIIPLEGPGHWLSLLPVIGTPLKRHAVRLFVERMNYPVALPNQFSGEQLMTEIKGTVSVDQVARQVIEDLSDTSLLEHRRGRLRETMPAPGAAAQLVQEVLDGMASA